MQSLSFSLQKSGRLLALLVAVFMTIALSVVLGSPAHAATAPQPVTPGIYAQAVADLAASDLPRSTVVVDGQTATVYDLGSGIEFAVAAAAAAPLPGEVHTDLSIGSNSRGNFVAFNHTDQQAVQNGGAATAAGLICLISVAVCIIGGGIVAALWTYISANGTCPGNQVLRVYHGTDSSGNWVATGTSCVASYAGA